MSDGMPEAGLVGQLRKGIASISLAIETPPVNRRSKAERARRVGTWEPEGDQGELARRDAAGNKESGDKNLHEEDS